MFANSREVQISGRPNFIYNDNKFSVGSEPLDEGIRLLLPRVVTGAMHNSGERFDAPTCHEETRIAIQEDILGWADELVDDLNELVTWMYGPAGAGKSAIAQTIAQKLHDRGQLTASFFFSRASGSGGRGEETNFVATLVHQLSQTVPATQPHIAEAVRRNPLVFDLALQDQVDALIVAPIVAISDASSGSGRPGVIVVDGLDECRQEKDAQRRVVDALVSGLSRIPHQNHKLLITSRPEYNIISVFKNYEEKLVRRMELNDRWNPDDDIRTFLNAGFADIRRTHFYFHSHPVDKTWPSPRIIDTLVFRSSSQFIYASVVLKYIKSEENYNPVARLETVLQLNNNDDRPYTELDALYEHILAQIRGVDRVLTVLSLERMYHGSGLPITPLKTFLSQFIGVHMNEIKFWLRPLASLLVWEEGYEPQSGSIHYMHASLPDFLIDQSRSNIFCISTPSIATGIVRRAIELLEDETTLKKTTSLSILLGIPFYYANTLPSEHKFYIYSLVSNFNLVETVLCKIDADFIQTSDATLALATYTEWVLRISENESASHYQKAFLKSVVQIKTWLINQFEHLQLDDFDNAERLDVWPFFIGRGYLDDGTKTSTKQISENFSAAVEICGSSICNHRLQGTNFSLSPQTAFLCYLMPNLTGSWLERSDLLGRYAMTTNRYGVALQRSAYYLLQLPKQILADILNGSNSEKGILETRTIRLISQALRTFLARSPRTTDLYFLMALTDPVMRCIMKDDRRYVSNYVEQTLQEFPFLEDSTSSDYIQAKTKVEENCINLKIKTSLHELVEKRQMRLYGAKLIGYRKLLAAFAVIDSRIPESPYNGTTVL